MPARPASIKPTVAGSGVAVTVIGGADPIEVWSFNPGPPRIVKMPETGPCAALDGIFTVNSAKIEVVWLAVKNNGALLKNGLVSVMNVPNPDRFALLRNCWTLVVLVSEPENVSVLPGAPNNEVCTMLMVMFAP